MIQKVADGRVEFYDIEITLSDLDKERFLDDPPNFIRGFLERGGHKVNRIFVTTELAARARRQVEQSRTGSDVRVQMHSQHIVHPANESSGWI